MVTAKQAYKAPGEPFKLLHQLVRLGVPVALASHLGKDCDRQDLDVQQFLSLLVAGGQNRSSAGQGRQVGGLLGSVPAKHQAGQVGQCSCRQRAALSRACEQPRCSREMPLLSERYGELVAYSCVYVQRIGIPHEARSHMLQQHRGLVVQAEAVEQGDQIRDVLAQRRTAGQLPVCAEHLDRGRHLPAGCTVAS